jgi:hypothetical protein
VVACTGEQEILKNAAIDLIARYAEQAADADFLDRIDVAAAIRIEEAEAELAQLGVLQVVLEAEDLRKVVCANLDRGFADLVRRLGRGVRTALDDPDVESRACLAQMQCAGQPARPPPRMITSCAWFT